MNKEQVMGKIKAMLKEEGKEHLMEFAEDLAELGWKAAKIVVEESETKIDDLVVASIDGVVVDLLDKIDGKED